LVISKRNSFRVLFGKIASVHFIWKISLYFSIGNSQSNRRSFVSYTYKKVKVAHTRLPIVGFRSWSRFFAVSLQVMSHKPGGRLPLLSARPAVTLATLKRAGTNFAAWRTKARWVWTVCLRLLPDSVATAILTGALLHAYHSATEPPYTHNVK